MSTERGSGDSAPNTLGVAGPQSDNGARTADQHVRTGWPFVERRRTLDRRQNSRPVSAGEPAAQVPLERRALDPKPIERAKQFTAREHQVVQLLLEGMSNKRIAQQLGIVEDTVKKHLQHIYDKLGVRSRTLVMLGQAQARPQGRSHDRRKLTG